MGGTISEEYGCAGWNNVAYGLAIAELARGSGSLATFLHVQSGLAMTAIHELGSEEQKRRWLPPMAKCEKIGCFGLTEPEAGSDPGIAEHDGRREGRRLRPERGEEVDRQRLLLGRGRDLGQDRRR